MDIEIVLVRLVSSMVQETVDMAEADPNKKMEREAHLYRLLAANCEEKARMADGIANYVATGEA